MTIFLLLQKNAALVSPVVLATNASPSAETLEASIPSEVVTKDSAGSKRKLSKAPSEERTVITLCTVEGSGKERRYEETISNSNSNLAEDMKKLSRIQIQTSPI
jgi:hypothetical protein